MKFEMTEKKSSVEITWSLMHPTPLDEDYMARVIREADASPVPVDSFEICAMCHSVLGGLDGLCHFPAFDLPQLDHRAIDANIARLSKIVDMAHGSGRPVYYWHREVTVPGGLVSLIPGLLDEKGEFDLLGEAFEKLIRLKFQQAFDNVPALDGIVLTLTEADYSAIHNSTPEKYPPQEVVRKVAGIFYEELSRRGKRFILRSFGSIAKDYEDILAGAELMAAEGKVFEVETKITPYDFDPFLPDNPFLRKIPGLTLGAECDSLGEFLGAGRLPAQNTEEIVKRVRAAQKAGVDRFVIRTDRVHSRVFDTYPVNLNAYMRAITEPDVTAAAIRKDFYSSCAPECADFLMDLADAGLQAVLKAHFIAGNVVFHQNPPSPDFKFLKAGGFFAHFSENVPLAHLEGIWAILARNTTTSRAEIMAEKQEALAIAQNGLNMLRLFKDKMPEKEYLNLLEQWNNLICCCTAMLSFCRCVCAYFDDMEQNSKDHPRLDAAAAGARESLSLWDLTVPAAKNPDGTEQNKFAVKKTIALVYPAPIAALCEKLKEEFEAEFAAAHDPRLEGALDFIIPGAITDEWRCERFMHACHALIDNKRPCRIVGNKIFPNGTLGFTLQGIQEKMELYLDGEGAFELTVNNSRSIKAVLSGGQRFPLEEKGPIHITARRCGGTDYPKLRAAALFVLKKEIKQWNKK